MYDVVRRPSRQAAFEPAIRHEVAETATLVTFVAADASCSSSRSARSRSTARPTARSSPPPSSISARPAEPTAPSGT